MKSDSMTTSTLATRYGMVDLLKGLAIIGVVFHHVGNRRFNHETLEHVEMLKLAFTWCVYAFIFVSGFLHSQSRRTDGAIEHIARRAVRLLVPYLWIGTLYSVMYHGIQKSGLLSDGRIDQIPPTLSGKLVELLKFHPVAGEQLYFFVLLFIVSALFVLLLKLGTSVWHLLAIVTASLASLAAVAISQHRNLQTTGFSAEMVLCGLFQYALGFLWGRTNGSQTHWITVSAVGVVTALTLIVIFSRWTLLALLAPLLLMQLLRYVNPRHWLGRPFDTLGAASSTIYAFHTPFVLQLLLIVFLRMKLPDGLNITLSILVTLMVCLGIHQLLNRYTALHLFRV